VKWSYLKPGKIMVAETYAPGTADGGVYFPAKTDGITPKHVTLRHGNSKTIDQNGLNGANYLFADGHVEYSLEYHRAAYGANGTAQKQRQLREVVGPREQASQLRLLILNLQGVTMALPKQLRGSRFGLGVASALFIVAAAALGVQLIGGRESGAGAVSKTAFYTDDNGKSFFKDDVNEVSPFHHNGKQAYRCDVFQTDGGKQFVGLVYRYTDSGRREIEAYFPNYSKDPDGSTRRAIDERGMQVKPVGAGDNAWTLNDDTTTSRLVASMKDSSGKPAKLVQP
jgi:prepilin-type processing-associated H-X9-DG protein